MKKLLILGVVFGGLFLTSCKKDWTCECQSYGEVTTYQIYNKTKKNARAQCTGEASIGLITVGGDNSCDIR